MKYGYDEAEWKENKLYIRKKNTKVELIPHEKHEGMYRIRWSDGTFGDFYNKARAKDNAIRATINILNKGVPSQLEGRTQP